jgi:tetratricopeptide (TPR) repeat protein
MLEMVQEEFNANALPEGFTQQTVEEAVVRARELNRDQQFGQAEEVLRRALAQAPGHPEALKELNRALMRGQVYGEGRWELLPELARQGEVILQTSDDEEIYRQLAQTLLAIPAMPEAIRFLEGWIAKKGPNPERLGMLAWAKGCVAEYPAAENLWREYLALARQAEPGVTVDSHRYVCYTLVDCFAEAGELEAAGRVARQGWELGRQWMDVPRKEIHNDWYWPMLFRQARLDEGEVAQTLLAHYAGRPEPEAQGAALSLRAYLEEPQATIAGWLGWVGERSQAGEWKLIETFRSAILMPLRQTGKWAESIRLAQGIWERLQNIPGPEAEKARNPWNWERFWFYGFVEAGDWETAESLNRLEIQARGLAEGGSGRIILAAARGEPTPAELVRAIEQTGVSSVDPYGLFGWYAVAREAAAAGDLPKAFEALRKSVAYWANPPYWYLKLWEKDAYWGEVRQHPEFKRIFAEKRERIGPVYGMLHYFPGW